MPWNPTGNIRGPAGPGLVHSDGLIIGNNGAKYKAIGCAIRNTGTGFALIDDATHSPINIASVATFSDRIELTYNFTASKVGTATVTCDETLAAYGYVAGASVGLDKMIIWVSQPGGWGDYVTVNGNTITNSLNGLITGVTRSTTAWNFQHDAIMGLTSGQASYRNPTYHAAVDSLGPTSTGVALYNASGTLINASAASGEFRFWIMRTGSRRVNPLTELTYANSNLFIQGLMEVA